MISRISPPPLPYLISGEWKYSSGRKKSPPSRNRGVGISTVQKKKKNNNTQLASKRPISQGWADHLKRLKIKNQLWKEQLSLLKVEAPFGGLKTCSPREILKIYAPNVAIWGYSTSFHKFIFHLLKSKNFSRLWLDKDIKNGELLIILLYPFVGSCSWQNTRRYEIYSLSFEQKSRLSEKCLVFSCPPPKVPDMRIESAVHPLLSHLDVDFIKGSPSWSF